jgi:hypothetical protein
MGLPSQNSTTAGFDNCANREPPEDQVFASLLRKSNMFRTGLLSILHFKGWLVYGHGHKDTVTFPL